MENGGQHVETLRWDIGQILSNGSMQDIEHAARYVCKMDWAMLHERWQLSEQALQSLCFSAAYVVTLLHHGLGFDKKSQQIQFVPQGNLSWAKGATWLCQLQVIFFVGLTKSPILLYICRAFLLGL